MKDWVVPFLQSLRPKTVSETSFQEEISSPVFTQKRLAGLFHNNFGSNDPVLSVIGSVLGDLPKPDFDKFVLSCPIFILADRLGFCHQVGPISKSTLIVFSEEISNMSWFAARGLVAHETCHILAGHTGLSIGDIEERAREDEANALARSFGFDEEIIAVYEYLLKRKGGS